LYKAKYGEDVDDEEEAEEEDDEQETKYVEKDGLKWVVTRGSPPSMSRLEDQLAEVKSLYKAKYGEDVDDEEEAEEEDVEQETKYVEKDGLKWVVTRGSPPSMSRLEDQLAEVKSLYKAKYGEDVDDEEEAEEEDDEQETKYVEKDGLKWVVTRGSPPLMSQLEDKLAEVKALYAKKFGESVDDEE